MEEYNLDGVVGKGSLVREERFKRPAVRGGITTKERKEQSPSDGGG